ncbi:MAG: HYR domain-containing protein [Bacteroidia bacterium]
MTEFLQRLTLGIALCTSTGLLFGQGMNNGGGSNPSPLAGIPCVSITCPPSVIAYASDTVCSAFVTYAAPNDTNVCISQGTPVTFNYTGSLQTYTVPPGTSFLRIDARGAQGGSVTTTCAATGGLGARMRGDVSVTPGEVISIMVGQQGLTNGSDAGGGGGSFVVRTGNVPLVVAGGGGGATNNIGSCGSNRDGINATITTSGTASANGLVAGGTNGNGGGASTGSGGGGGGFLTDGTAGQGLANNNGKSYLNGGAGGTGNNNDFGGYGGGGAGWFTGGNGGGGGGYSGGGTSGSQPFTGGGGGGSYNIGTNQVNAAGFQTGNGQVIITPISSGPTYTSMTSGLASGSAFPVGTTTNLFTVVDSLGSSDTCMFNVTVMDTTEPEIICTNMTVSNDPGTCGAVVTFQNPTASDACQSVNINQLSGPTNGSVFASGSTTLVFEADDSNGNTDTCSFTITVIVDDSSTQTLSICDGESVTVGSSTYNTSGTYTDVLLNGGGCDSVVTTILTVAAPINTGTTVSGGVITSSESGATYQWVDCDNSFAPISGATNQSFQPSVDGNYAVIVTQGNCSDTSSCSVVVSMSEALGTTVLLHPNPSTGRVTLSFGTTLEQVELQVMDITGKIIHTETASAAQRMDLNLSDRAEGVYLIRVRTAAGEETLRFVKQN